MNISNPQQPAAARSKAVCSLSVSGAAQCFLRGNLAWHSHALLGALQVPGMTASPTRTPMCASGHPFCWGTERAKGWILAQVPTIPPGFLASITSVHSILNPTTLSAAVAQNLLDDAHRDKVQDAANQLRSLVDLEDSLATTTAQLDDLNDFVRLSNSQVQEPSTNASGEFSPPKRVCAPPSVKGAAACAAPCRTCVHVCAHGAAAVNDERMR